MRFKKALPVIGMLIAAWLMWTVPGSSDSCMIGGGGFPFDFKCVADVDNFLSLTIPRDVFCSFIVEIDMIYKTPPIIRKVTQCDNVLRFVTTSDLEMIITKHDLTFPPTGASAAVLDALGLYVDRTDPDTACTFYDKFGEVKTTPAPWLNMEAVLHGGPVPFPPSNPPDELWFDPQGPSSQSLVLFHHPGNNARVLDCSFKLDFFLDPGQVANIAAGRYSYTMEFTAMTDADLEE